MPGYVVSAVFDLYGARGRTGRDPLAADWGRGHRFSYCDGRVLSLVVEVPAVDRAEAFDFVVARARHLWAALGGEPLPAPSTLQVQAVAPRAKLLSGPVGRGPDCLIAESTARVDARLRATRAALADLDGRLGRGRGDDVAGPDEPRSLPEIEALLPPRR